MQELQFVAGALAVVVLALTCVYVDKLTWAQSFLLGVVHAPSLCLWDAPLGHNDPTKADRWLELDRKETILLVFMELVCTCVLLCAGECFQKRGSIRRGLVVNAVLVDFVFFLFRLMQTCLEETMIKLTGDWFKWAKDEIPDSLDPFWFATVLQPLCLLIQFAAWTYVSFLSKGYDYFCWTRQEVLAFLLPLNLVHALLSIFEWGTILYDDQNGLHVAMIFLIASLVFGMRLLEIKLRSVNRWGVLLECTNDAMWGAHTIVVPMRRGVCLRLLVGLLRFGLLLWKHFVSVCRWWRSKKHGK